jgi:hypothetical protein
MNLTVDQEQALDIHLAARQLPLVCPACGSDNRALTLVQLAPLTGVAVHQALYGTGQPIAGGTVPQGPGLLVRLEIMCRDCGMARYLDPYQAGVLS